MHTTSKGRAARLTRPATWLSAALATFLVSETTAQTGARVLFWGGPATTSHNVPAFRDTIVPYLTSLGMTVSYRQNPPYSWLHADSLAQHDVLLVYTTNQNASDLTSGQLAALTAWLASGRVMVALHGTTNTFITGNTATTNAWRALTGAQFLDHGPASGSGNSGTMTYTPLGNAHPALATTTALPASAANSGGQPYWDEGRRHTANLFASDTLVLARAHYTTPSATSLPWIWVRPQGNGWVYYNASGHDAQVWSRLEFKTQIVRALQWGHTVKTTGIRGQAALRALTRGRTGMLHVPFAPGTAHTVEVFDPQGRRVYFRSRSRAGGHDLSFLPPGHYGVSLTSERRENLRSLYIKTP